MRMWRYGWFYNVTCQLYYVITWDPLQKSLGTAGKFNDNWLKSFGRHRNQQLIQKSSAERINNQCVQLLLLTTKQNKKLWQSHNNGFPFLMGGQLGPKCLLGVLTAASMMACPSTIALESAEVLKPDIVKDPHPCDIQSLSQQRWGLSLRCTPHTL